MHTALVAGWSGSMLIYELIVIDPSDPVYNPIWRQGSYVLPYVCKLGVVASIYNWNVGLDSSFMSNWSFETVAFSHILLSGLLVLASSWHWAFWDLDIFISSSSGKLVLDLNRIFGIHLALASITCLGFGLVHLASSYGPGFWTSDSFGIVGTVRKIKSFYSMLGLNPYCYGVLSSHHISSGFFGFAASLWHISSKPGPTIYRIINISNIENVLSTSITAVFYSSIVTSSQMWYGSLSNPIELFGPTRFSWDNGYFSIDIERRIKSYSPIISIKAWEQIPDKLVFYDYIGTNPAKGGLFRSGPNIKGDGIAQNWLGHPTFLLGTLNLTVRRMPSFFETFPVVLIDDGGTVRADIPFRRAESRYSIEQTNVTLTFAGGILSGNDYSYPSLIKGYARKSQFGQIFTFDKITSGSDGVFRTSSRGWYAFLHLTFTYLFFFGHLWHAARALFKSIWTGLSLSSQILDSVEYGRNEKLGENSTKTDGVYL